MFRSTPLLTSQTYAGLHGLVVGHDTLAASRTRRLLAADVARVYVITPVEEADMAAELRTLVASPDAEGRIIWVHESFSPHHLSTLGREEVANVVDVVFCTLRQPISECLALSQACRRLRIPVNVADEPSMCTFSLLATHSDDSLHIAVTTSGKGCKLASRILREVVSALPPNIGRACDRIAEIREGLNLEDLRANPLQHMDSALLNELASTEEAEPQTIKLNQSPAGELGVDEDAFEPSLNPEGRLSETTQAAASGTYLQSPSTSPQQKLRRLRWLTQICEYWPLDRLAALTRHDIEVILDAYKGSSSGDKSLTDDKVLEHTLQKCVSTDRALHLDAQRPRGEIYLVGAGPGSVGLVTQAARDAIDTADLVLADKLVPSTVLALVPRRTPVEIARKFPGNAEKAQEELLNRALEAMQSGQRVVRLKQGDPYIFGRGGEEYEYFTARGFSCTVVPGISSALAALTLARVPATQRAVADQLLICTGTGRKGAAPDPPEWAPTRTTVFLMALHRLDLLVAQLDKAGWPLDTPCAIIERASCRDQRIARTTLRHAYDAYKAIGSRPPGLFVVGHTCHALVNPEFSQSEPWVVEDGFSESISSSSIIDLQSGQSSGS